MQEYIQHNFPTYDFKILNVTAGIDVKLNILSSAVMLITPSGSTAFDQFFLPARSAVIQFPFCYSYIGTCKTCFAGACRVNNMTANCCQAFEYGEIFAWISDRVNLQYPVFLSEVVDDEIAVNMTRLAGLISQGLSMTSDIFPHGSHR
jgi:hypothetical protein